MQQPVHVRLREHATFAVAGDAYVRQVVRSLGGHAVEIGPAQRVRYHAAATIAANHLTALCAQVERLAADVGMPVAAYWSMMNDTLDNVAEHGAAATLTGPASRPTGRRSGHMSGQCPPNTTASSTSRAAPQPAAWQATNFRSTSPRRDATGQFGDAETTFSATEPRRAQSMKSARTMARANK